MRTRLLFLTILAVIAGCGPQSIEDTFSIEGDWYCRFDFYEDAGRWRLDRLLTFTEDSVYLHPAKESRALAFNLKRENELLILEPEYQRQADTLYIGKAAKDTLRYWVNQEHILRACGETESGRSTISRLRSDTSLHIKRVGLASRGCNNAPACPRYAFEIDARGDVHFEGFEHTVVDGPRKSGGQRRLFERLTALGQSLNLTDEVRWDGSHDQYFGLIIQTADTTYRLRGPYQNFGALASLIDEIEVSLTTIPWEPANADKGFEALEFVREPEVM